MQSTDCSYERVTLCAFDALSDVTKKVAFMGCMDEAQLSVTYNDTFARTCAKGVQWEKIRECFTGARGDKLVERARNATKKAGSGIPSVLVDGTVACGKGVSCGYDAVAKYLSAESPTASQTV